MSKTAPAWYEGNLMVIEGPPREKTVPVLCGVCHQRDHQVFADGTLKCTQCHMMIAPLESVLRKAILNVNLPETWEVSWRL